MNRRHFLKQAALYFSAASMQTAPRGDQVMTVLGPIRPSEMGMTLPHEHVLVDFVGAEQASPSRYDAEAVFKTALPHVRRVRALGCRTFVDCTPAFIGRDPGILKRLASAAGLNILTNTGYYGAANDKFVPRHAYDETAEQLSQRWVREWQQGIAETGIRPGFIKIGVDSGPLSAIDRKLVQAAALTHLESGLTIASHTGNSVAALEQIEALKEAGVDPNAWIWVHAKREPDAGAVFKAARSGAWIEFDSIGPTRISQNVELVKAMKDARLLGRVLISQDAGWYHVGEPGGGKFQPFDTLFVEFLPALRRAGFSQSEINALTIANPAAAFGIKVRRSTP